MGGDFYHWATNCQPYPPTQHTPPSSVSALAAQLLSALAFMHGRGVVHLDIKPDNIMAMAPTIDLVAGSGGLGGGSEGFDGSGAGGGGGTQQLKITDFGKSLDIIILLKYPV